MSVRPSPYWKASAAKCRQESPLISAHSLGNTFCNCCRDLTSLVCCRASESITLNRLTTTRKTMSLFLKGYPLSELLRLSQATIPHHAIHFSCFFWGTKVGVRLLCGRIWSPT